MKTHHKRKDWYSLLPQKTSAGFLVPQCGTSCPLRKGFAPKLSDLRVDFGGTRTGE